MNGYFQLSITENGTGVKVFPPTDGGKSILTADVREYLDTRNIQYDIKAVDTAVTNADGNVVVFTEAKILPERESYRLTVSDDEMMATAYFYPPSDGAQGELMTAQEVLTDLSYKNITYGVQKDAVEAFFAKRMYCTELVVAEGKPVKEGVDASIEYMFNSDLHAKPKIKEDGTVDFFNLDLICHCQAGDVLAKLTPEDLGEDGWSIYDKPVSPQQVKHLDLKGNKNCVISEDKLTLSAGVSGHVSLNQGEVMVSNVYTVDNVDVSTGNVKYDGSIVISGDVDTGFEVNATGDVEVKGSVAGAKINAKGNVVLNRGINGMGKGEIVAGGNVVTKYIESASVRAGGTVSAESIMHSKVMAGTEIYVDGKRGFISGSQVSAKERITAKTLGSEMGANTLVEVGVDPTVKERVKKMQAQIADAEKKREAIQPTLQNFMKLLKSGAKLNEQQTKFAQQTLTQNKILEGLIAKNTAEIERAKELMQEAKRAEIIVNDNCYPGTTIGISDLSMNIKAPVRFSRFIIKEGEIRIAPVN
ncbi:MAG: DUF342 domain-containing protein [Lachnospiraceae bacterium]|nr:DUF342 domain-containing protein [Lachnospiraceae bacterium]